MKRNYISSPSVNAHKLPSWLLQKTARKRDVVNAIGETFMRTAQGVQKADFFLRAKSFPRRYYVYARFDDGRVFKITRFEDRQNALDWIADCSAHWIEEFGGDGLNASSIPHAAYR